MAKNLTPFGLSAAAVTARNAEYTDTPFTDIDGDGDYNTYLGCNRAGSNAPGIGINTGNLLLTAAQIAAGDVRWADWTELDQFEAARIPQDTQHIGGIEAAEDITADPRFTPGDHVANLIVDQDGTPDFNDTANLVVTDAAAIADGIMDTVSGAINKTGVTVGIGDLIWGPVPVA